MRLFRPLCRRKPAASPQPDLTVIVLKEDAQISWRLRHHVNRAAERQFQSPPMETRD
jgi:hypothetical protein